MADDLQIRFGGETSGVERAGDRTKATVVDVRQETEKTTKAAEALRSAVGRMLNAPADNLSPAAERAGRSVDNLGRTSVRTAQDLDKLEREAQQAGRAAAAAGVQVDRAAQANTRFDSSARGAHGAAALFAGALGAIGLRQVAGDIQEAAFAGFSLDTSLKAATGSARNANGELSFVEDTAADLGLVVRDSAQGFAALANTTKGTRLEGQATRDIWLGLVTAGVALGRSNEQIKRGQEAINQIASKGVVSMEEIRQQLAEAIPGSTQIAARALGVTTGEFVKLVESGKLASEDFLPKFAAQLRREFGPSLEEAMNTPLGIARRRLAEFSNATFEAKQAAGQGFLSEMAAGLQAVNEQLRSEDGLNTARELGESLGEAFTAGAKGAIFLAQNIDNVVLAAQMLAGVALVRWLVTTAGEARAAAGAYAAKGVAARSAAAQGVASAAAEGAANITLTGQIRAAAAAEVAKAEASLVAARATLALANAQAAEARSTLVATGAGVAYTEAKVALTAANARLIAAENGVALAAGRVAAAQGVATASTTLMGRAMVTARAAASGLLGLVGGPWGAAFLAAGAAVYYTVRANQEAAEKIRDANEEAKRTADAYRAQAAAAKVLGDESGRLATETDTAAVAAAQMTGETDKLADAHYRAAAGAKAQAVEELRLAAILAGKRATEATEAFQRRRSSETGQAYAMQAGGGRGAGPNVGADVQRAGAQAALASTEFETMRIEAGNARTAAAQLRAEMERPLASYLPDSAGAPSSAASSGGGSGGSGPGKVARWQNELDARLTAEENFFRDSRDAELAFWVEKRALTAEGTSERLEVDRKIFGLRKQLAEDDLRTQLEALDTQQQAAQGDLAEQIRIQDEKLSLLRDAYGEESREYERAAQDRIRLEQEKAAEILAINRELIQRTAEFASGDSEAAAEANRYRIEDERSTIDTMAALGMISAQQRTERLNALAAEERRLETETANAVFAIQIAALRSQLDLEGMKPQERERVLREIERLEREHAQRMGVLAAQQASDLKRESDAAVVEGFNRWKSAIDPIGKGFGDLVNNAVTGARSIRDVWAEVGQSLLNNVTGYLSQVVTNWLASQLAMTTAHVAGETTKTAATAVGATARTGIEATAAATTIATSGAVTIADVANSAIRAAAGAYAAIAGIPFVGPVLAPLAAAGALAAVLALGKSIFSAKGGAERVANDGDMYELHRDEMVLPARIANPLRSMVGNLGVPSAGSATAAAYAGVGASRDADAAERSSMADSLAALQSVAGRAGGGGGTTINAVDAKSVERLLRDHAKSTQRGLERRARNLQTRKPK